MQRRNDCPLKVRALLESLGVPFRIGRYRRREPLFLQGDACESVMYIEKGRVWLAVTARSGEEASRGLLAAAEHRFLDEAGGVVHVRPSLLHVVDDRHPGHATRSLVTEENHS